MPNSSTQFDAHEIRNALDDLLQVFLVVSPQSADHPAVKHARNLVSRGPKSLQAAAYSHEVRAQACTQASPEIPESFIVGLD